MYTLRIIEETRENENAPFEQVIENHELGNAYTKLKKGSTTEFDSVMKKLFPEESGAEVNTLICGENEKVFFILQNTPLRENGYFIMSENGQTFERL